MRIEIEIAKEFEKEFNKDRFEESLSRLLHDSHLLAGKYERETAEMLIEAFKNAKPAYDVDNVCRKLSEIRDIDNLIDCDHAKKIVRQGGINE
jgi:hypothetical protein